MAGAEEVAVSFFGNKTPLGLKGLMPYAHTLKMRNTQNGMGTILNEATVKFSDLLKQFVFPALTMDDDLGALQAKFFFGLNAWNAAVVKEKDEKKYQLLKKEFLYIVQNDPAANQLYDEMVQAKKEDFSMYKNMFVDLEIKQIEDSGFDLSVCVTP